MLRCLLHSILLLHLLTGTNSSTDYWCNDTRSSKWSGLRVTCNISTWEDLPCFLLSFNPSEVVDLRVRIFEESARLTAGDLRGLKNLNYLEVIGSCHDEGVGSNNMSAAYICEDVRGLQEIEAGAFRDTPSLTTIKLARHPLRNLSLDGLTGLRNLHLRLEYLEDLPVTVLDPIRVSLKHFSIKRSRVEVLHQDIFSKMENLISLSWSGKLRRIEGGAIAHLPHLESLKLSSWSLSLVQIGVRAFHNLPRLRSVHLYNISYSPIPEQNGSICDLRGANVEDLIIYSGNDEFLRLCEDLFSCASGCSRQDVRLVNVSTEDPEGAGLDSLLPPWSLNITKLDVIGCQVESLDDAISRLPLLRNLSFHRKVPEWYWPYLVPAPTYGNLLRLSNDSFLSMTKNSLIMEVNLVIDVCDCAVLDLIQWKARISHLKLKVGCENFRCTCIKTADDDFQLCNCIRSKDTRSQFEQDLKDLAVFLATKCDPSVSQKISFADKEDVCRPECEPKGIGGDGGNAKMALPEV